MSDLTDLTELEGLTALLDPGRVSSSLRMAKT